MGRALRFSVGIPTRNQADFLPQTLDSLLNQRRPPDEIVISDHQSTDHTAEIIADYAQRYPGLIRGTAPPQHSDVSGQWRWTLGQLSGDWVTLLSSDDIAYSNYCEVLVRGAERRDDAVLVRAGWDEIDPQGNVLQQQYLLSAKRVTLPPETLLEQKNGPKASFAAFAVKREMLMKSGGYPTGFESYGDWPMFVQVAPYGSFIYEPVLISGYRTGHEQNKIRTRFGMWVRDEYRMCTEVLPLAAERLELKDRRWIREASRVNFLRWVAAASQEFAPEERAQFLPDLRPWAALVGANSTLERFAAGHRVVPPVTLNDVARKVLRPFAQRVARAAARR